MAGSTAATGTYDLSLGGSSDTRTWLVGGATLYAIDIAGTTTVLGDGIDDGADAEVFDHRLPPGPGIAASEVGPATFTPETLALADGLGVDRAGDTTYSNQGDASNSEINVGENDDEEVSDRLGVGLGREATAGEATLSAFYFRDGMPSGPRGIALAETAVVKVGTDANRNGILDAGEVEGSARIVSGGAVQSEAGTLDITGAAALENDGTPIDRSGNQYSPENAGLFRFTFETTDPWDTIEFSSGGLVRPISGNTNFRAGDRDVSDFWLKELRVDLADDGGDRGGDGDDGSQGPQPEPQPVVTRIGLSPEVETAIGTAGKDIFAAGINISGGAGNPGGFSFIIRSGVGEGLRDVIRGFEQGVDIIDLGQLNRDASPRSGFFADEAFEFVGTEEFTPGGGGQPQLRYEVHDDRTIVQLDGATLRDFGGPADRPPAAPPDGVVDAEIELVGVYALTAGDIIL